MTKAGDKEVFGGRKMPIKTRKELPMPEELYIKLTKVIYQLYQ